MDNQQIYINVDLKDLIMYLREIGVSEDQIKKIVGYCVRRRDEELEEARKNGVR